MAVVAALVLVLIVPAHAAGSSSSETVLSRQLDFSGNNSTPSVSFNLPVLSRGATISSSTLEVATVANPQLGPANLTLKSGTNTTLWRWPEGFGWYGSQSGPWLTADNQTITRVLQLPTHANIVDAQAALENSVGSLEGNYVVNATLNSGPLFERSGGEGYGPIRPLGWGGTGSNLTVAALGSEFNGTSLVAVGDNKGILSLYLLSPGELGQQVYQTTLSAPFPVVAVSVTKFPNTGSLSVVAISGSNVYVIEQTASNGWGTSILTVPSSTNSISPFLTSLEVIRYENGYPAILAGATNSQLYVWNWSASLGSFGFPNPGQTLKSLPWVPESLSCNSHIGDPSLVAVGGNEQIQILNVTTQSVSVMTTLALPNGVSANSVSFNSSGNLLVAGGSDGSLYPFAGPGWQSSKVVTLSVEPIVGFSFDTQLYNNTLVVDTQGNNVYTVFGVGSGNPSVRVLGIISSGGVIGPPVTGPIFGSGESDLVIPAGIALMGSISTATFNATQIDAFQSGLTSALPTSSISFDNYSNEWSNVPVRLDSQGGKVSLWGVYVAYQLTQDVSITGLISNTVHSGSTGSQKVTFSFSATMPGQIYIMVTLDILEPPPLSLWQPYYQFFIANGLYLAEALAVAGTALTIAGVRGYLHPPSAMGSVEGRRERGSSVSGRGKHINEYAGQTGRVERRGREPTTSSSGER